jgi:gamma-glutamyltranspeptidase
MPYSTPDARAARPAFSGHPAKTPRSAAKRASGIDLPPAEGVAEGAARAATQCGAPCDPLHHSLHHPAHRSHRHLSGGGVIGIVRIAAAAMSALALTASLVAGAPAYGKTAPKPAFDGSAVAVPDRYSADTAQQIFAQGGNAVDAAVAIAFTLAVTSPDAGNLGGGGYMTLQVDGKPYFLDYSAKAPQRATRNMYLDDKGNEVKGMSSIGHRAVGVPGTVDGMWEAQRRFGKLKWKQVLAPAIRYATDGFVVEPWLQQRRDTAAAEFGGKTNFNAYFSGLKAGTTYRQPELAQTLQRIADDGGREFYEGQTADLIAKQMYGHGVITKTDLTQYKAVWRQPLTADWHGYQIVTAPPPSSGGVALIQLLKMKSDLKTSFGGVPLNSAPYIHLVAQMEDRVFADRQQYITDPDSSAVPVDKLTSDSYVASRVDGVKPVPVKPVEAKAEVAKPADAASGGAAAGASAAEANAAAASAAGAKPAEATAAAASALGAKPAEATAAAASAAGAKPAEANAASASATGAKSADANAAGAKPTQASTAGAGTTGATPAAASNAGSVPSSARPAEASTPATHATAAQPADANAAASSVKPVQASAAGAASAASAASANAADNGGASSNAGGGANANANGSADANSANAPPAQTAPAQTAPADPSGTASVKPGAAGDAPAEKTQTTHFSVVDKWGNAVSNTYTLNGSFGSGVVVDGGGFVLNDAMDDFVTKPAAGVNDMNAIAPGRRPVSSLTPTILLKGGKVALVIGTPGGSRIFTTIFQVMTDMYDFGMSPTDALAALRFHHQLLPAKTIYWEPYRPINGELAQQLQGLGYTLEGQTFNGDVQLIRIDGTTPQPAADPRGAGVARVFQ